MLGPVTDCRRSRTELVIALKLSEVSLSQGKAGVQEQRCVGWAVLYLSCASVDGSSPKGCCGCTEPGPRQLQRDAQRGQQRWHAPALTWGLHRLLLPRVLLRVAQGMFSLPWRQPIIPSSSVYTVPAAGTTRGTFKPLNKSIGGLLNRNALKSFEKEQQMHCFTELVSLVSNSARTTDYFYAAFLYYSPQKVTEISMKLTLLVSHIAEMLLP